MTDWEIKHVLNLLMTGLIIVGCILAMYGLIKVVNEDKVKQSRMGTLTYVIHYPDGAKTKTVRCHDYQLRVGRGRMSISYCTCADKHYICNDYTNTFATTAPIEIISFTY